MAPEDLGNYTVKEMISLMVLPRLDELKEMIKTKADEEDLRALALRVHELETKALTPEKVEAQFAGLFQSAKARGWKTWERAVGIGVAMTSLTGFLLSSLVAIKTLTGG